ncbi:MAG TPA: DUF5666 domain-containing protein [Vicinamibacterales bacterium]|jgi:hypothetical protein
MTESKSRWMVFALGVALLATSVACGNSSGSLSPTGPSANGSSGAVITGRVHGLSTPTTTDSFAPLATSSVKVTISGTNISSTIDGTGQFTLTGVPPGNVTLQFSGPGVSASITLTGVTADQQITIDVTLNGSSARVNSENRRDNGGHEVEGRITAIDAAARTISVGGKVIAVPAGTKIHRGTTTLTFADLKVGDDVEVETTMNGTTLIATDVKIDDDKDDDDHDGLTEVSGAVSGLSGSCPTITFVVRDRTIVTTGNTRFDLGCDKIKNTVRVEAKGALAANGALMATSVELDD